MTEQIKELVSASSAISRISNDLCKGTLHKHDLKTFNMVYGGFVKMTPAKAKVWLKGFYQLGNEVHELIEVHHSMTKN